MLPNRTNAMSSSGLRGAYEEFLNSKEPQLEVGDPIAAFILLLCIAIMIVGFISWVKLPKFRTYQNFVFLNVITAGCFSILFPLITAVSMIYLRKGISFMHYYGMITMIFFFFEAFNFWFLVVCVMFYLDLVKVFNGNITRRYLKSALFAWGVPLVATAAMASLVLTLDESDIYTPLHILLITLTIIAMIILPLFINLCLYLSVLWSLLRSTDVARSSDICKRILLASLVFVMTGFIFVSSFFFVVLFGKDDHNGEYAMYLQLFQVILINVYFVMLKANRRLWWQEIQKRMKPK